MSGPSPFVGSYIGTITLASTPEIGVSAYSPVNGFLYLGAGTSVWVIDLSGTPSVVATITLAASLRRIAYLPIANKIFVLQASNKYQLIDCAAGTVAAQVTFSPTFANAPSKCNSFSVDPATDDVYLQNAYQLGRVTPSTGATTTSGYGTTTYLNYMDAGRDLCFNPADGRLYVIGAAAHALMSIDISAWTTNAGLLHDFGSIADVDPSSKFVLNRLNGHVYMHHPTTAALSVLTAFNSRTVITPTTTLAPGDYDSALGQNIYCESINPPQFVVYADNDTQLLRTTVTGCAGTPSALYCAPGVARYAVQQTGGSSSILQVIAR